MVWPRGGHALSGRTGVKLFRCSPGGNKLLVHSVIHPKVPCLGGVCPDHICSANLRPGSNAVTLASDRFELALRSMQCGTGTRRRVLRTRYVYT
jgi:hypothetical protein